MHLKARYPLKSDDVINSLGSDIESGSIAHEEWSDIVKYMYNEEDSVTLSVLCREVCRRHATNDEIEAAKSAATKGTPRKDGAETTTTTRGPGAAAAAANGGAANRQGKMPYSDFVKVLLDFQLLGHERFLSNFKRSFDEVDADKDGIINEDGFRTVVNTFGTNSLATGKGGNTAASHNKAEAEIRALLKVADPFNNDSVTFSDAVSTLSQLIVDNVVGQAERLKKVEEVNNKRRERGMKEF